MSRGNQTPTAHEAPAGNRSRHGYAVSVARTHRGYTLLEAVLVAAVLGVLVALALPAYRSVVFERRVQNVTREIAADLRVAQQAAVAKSAEARCVAVVFGERQVNVYVVPESDQGVPSECDPSASGSFNLLTSQEFPQGVAVSPSNPSIAFLPSGEPTPAPFRVTVSADGHRREVCVNTAGLVSVPPPGGSCP